MITGLHKKALLDMRSFYSIFDQPLKLLQTSMTPVAMMVIPYYLKVVKG